MEMEEWFGASQNKEDETQKSSPLKSLKIDLDYYNDSIKEISLEIMGEDLIFGFHLPYFAKLQTILPFP